MSTSFRLAAAASSFDLMVAVAPVMEAVAVEGLSLTVAPVMCLTPVV